MIQILRIKINVWGKGNPISSLQKDFDKNLADRFKNKIWNFMINFCDIFILYVQYINLHIVDTNHVEQYSRSVY